jgi:hypothetical protein
MEPPATPSTLGITVSAVCPERRIMDGEACKDAASFDRWIMHVAAAASAEEILSKYG